MLGAVLLPPAQGVAQEFTISTVAGAGRIVNLGDGGPAVEAQFYSPDGVAVDGAGNLYIADTEGNHIRKVDPTTGTITTIAGTGEGGFSGDGGPATLAQLNYPSGVAVDGAGNLYLADQYNHRIRKVDSTGTITTIAGTGEGGFSWEDSPASQAKLYNPSGVAMDAAGNLYIADQFSHSIRKVDATTKTITTIAGTRVYGSGGDGGPATQAHLFSPHEVAVDGAGNVYIADTSNRRIRKVDATTGMIATIAGTGVDGFGGDGGPATLAQLSWPTGVAVDSAGNVYITDRNSHRIRKVDATTKTITTIGGTGELGFSGDGGPASQAHLYDPLGVAVDGAGNLYIADSTNSRIRKINATTGTIATIAGRTFSGDGGPASQAQLYHPLGVAVDGAGNLYIADFLNNRIRKVDSIGTITTIAGTGESGFSGDAGPATLAQLYHPLGVAVDGADNLYIADARNHRIRKVDSTGTITTIAGTGESGFSGDAGPATLAQLYGPSIVAVDGADNLYIADARNHRIRKVDSTGMIETIAGTGVRGFGGVGEPATQTRFDYPRGVAVDGAGNIYITDQYNHRIRKVDSTGTITTIAGTGQRGFSGDEGPATQAQLSYPSGMALDGAGNIYIPDTVNHRIRKVDSTGTITTIAGTGQRGFSGDEGPATQAQLNNPRGVAVDGAGNIYIADQHNHRIRKLTPVGPSAVQPFSITDLGGASFSSQGASPTTVSGYGQVAADEGMTAPDGLAIFGFRHDGILVSEAGVPAVETVLEGRIFAETDGAVRTGLAIANPNDGPATIGFFFTDSNGMDYGNGSLMLEPREQRARFLDEDPFNGGSGMLGTFTFTSNQPVAVIALRGFVNERSEFLMTTLPVAPLSAPNGRTVYFPHFTDGGGWTTQVILVNPTDAPIQGSVQFRSPGSATAPAGAAALTLADGRTGSEFTYSIPPHSATRLETANPAGSTQQSGSVRVVADAGSSVPSGVIVFAYERGGVTVSEAGVPATDPGAAFRVYVETSGTPGQPDAVRSGIALTNTSGTAAAVTLELTALDGTSTGPSASLTIPASGQVARFIDQIFPALTPPFSGILRIASTPRTPFDSRARNLAVIGLRLTTNERGDIVVTTTPPSNEDAATTASDLFFPHFVDSSGWTTQFILYSGAPGGTSSGSLRFTGQDGQPLALSVSATSARTIP